MTPHYSPLHETPFETTSVRAKPRREAEIIAGRIASARKWRQRRTLLRLRAALFGRRKTGREGRREDRGREPAGAPPASVPRSA